ncbi:amidase [Thozetella sp. PMI_491]|nr:amidase [Thozetella sp. PMI_491]
MRSLARLILVPSCMGLALGTFVHGLVTTKQADTSTIKGQPFPSLINATIQDLATGLESGLFTSVDLVKAYIARIGEVNGALHAVTEINPDALAIAAELDDLRSRGISLGCLHGIPILIKNNIATMDKMNNTAGSWALLGSKVPEDSMVARKLRQAGAIILGKDNMSEWAVYRSTNSNNGWSALGGQVYSAYYPKLDPSGSSSGGGVSASLGLALASLGTQTFGSIISPASRNNLVGIKPTVGLVSRYLVIPISEHQDSVGPMARTVTDAATLLSAIAGYDPKDNYTSAIPDYDNIPDYTAGLDVSALEGARIGIPYNALPNGNSIEMAAFNQAVAFMKSEGAIILPANFKNPKAPTSSTTLPADFVSNLAAYLAELTYNPNNITSLADLRRYTQSSPLEDYPNRNTGLWDAALALGYNNTDWRFWVGLQQNLLAGGDLGLLGAYESNNLDAIIMPSSYSYGPADIVGAPIVTVPLGFYPKGRRVAVSSRGLVTDGPNIPFGLSFLGGKFTEQTLIKLAYAYEQKSKTRDKLQPYLVPKTEIGDIVGF